MFYRCDQIKWFFPSIKQYFWYNWHSRCFTIYFALYLRTWCFNGILLYHVFLNFAPYLRAIIRTIQFSNSKDDDYVFKTNIIRVKLDIQLQIICIKSQYSMNHCPSIRANLVSIKSRSYTINRKIDVTLKFVRVHCQIHISKSFANFRPSMSVATSIICINRAPPNDDLLLPILISINCINSCVFWLNYRGCYISKFWNYCRIKLA